MDIKKHRHEIEFLILLVFFLLIWYFGKSYNLNTETLELALKKFPVFYSGILYVVLYVVITFFIFFSKDVFWVVGALLFGAPLSTLFICIAEVINAVILFHLARHFGRAYVEKSLSVKYQHLDERLGKINLLWLFIFRAAPLIPYRFMDLAAGFTKIHFRRYLIAVILGSPLKMFWIQYILTGIGKGIFNNPGILVEYFLSNRNLLLFSLIYPVLVVLVVLKIRHKE